jgi:dTDP-4-amino-4,6-dideoxygalactose transaminase
MISRLRPTIGIREFAAALSPSHRDDVERFEGSFAKLMGQKYSLAFPYGRTGMILLFEALGLKQKEIICPAYTCVVVPHSIVYSGNTPVFVDCEQGSFNMDLGKAGEVITKKTGAIISTSLFGYPVDLDKLDALKKKYPHVFIIQDCAHSFAAEWKGRPVQKAGTAAVFGLNVSKMLTSIFGGMITTNDDRLYFKLRHLRDKTLHPADWKKGFRRFTYLIAAFSALWEPVYGMINFLERYGYIDYFIRYYDESEIDMPADYLQQMTALEARVGKANIALYEEIIKSRRAAAKCYFTNFIDKPEFILPPKVYGATYSHFVVQVEDRNSWLKEGIKKGIQLGWLIEYSIPEMKAYGSHDPAKFPLAGKYSRSTINLPVWGGKNLSLQIIKRLGND